VGESFTAALGQEMGADLAEDWVMRSLWKRLAQKIGDALDRISLEDLYFDARSWQAAKGQDSNFII
jgi:DNA-binding IscR family transcriptional regulator